MAMVTAVLVAVMATAVTVGIGCDGDVGGGHGDGDCVCGAGGVKEAIQDLYAEIVGGGDPPDTRLDDVASAKARFVSDSLRRMIDNCETATIAAQVTLAEGGGGGGGGDDDTVVERKLRSQQKAVIDALKRYDETHGADVGERTAKHVDWLMDKCVEIALAKRAAGTTVAAKSAGEPRVDMGALHKRCNELLEQFERSRTSAATVHCRGVFGHKSRTSPKARSPPKPRPPTPTTRAPPPPPPPPPPTTPTPTARPPSTVRPLTTTKPTQPPRRPSSRSIGRLGLSQLSERPRAAVVDR